MPCVSEMAAAIGSAHLQLLSHPHAMICPSIENGEQVMAGKNNVAYQQVWRVAKAFTLGALAQGENVVWSPACIASLLAIMREGSSGVVRKELDELLGKGDVLSERDSFGTELDDHWGYKGYEASSAIAAWLSNSVVLSQEFLDKCDKAGVFVSHDDLSDPRATKAVTNWISEQTRGLLAPVVDLTPDALACLVSTLYLKDAWGDPLEERDTKVDLFHAADGDVEAAFIRDTRYCAVVDSDDCVAFSLSLSSDAGMLFALPEVETCRAEDALALFEKLSRGEGDSERVELSIPHFECELTLSDFGALLEAAGVSTALAMNMALMVGTEATPAQIVHGAKLAVDEEGVEAGACTVMSVCLGIPQIDPSKPRVITLNRPFFVAVVSRIGVPLFVGKVSVPSRDALVWRDIRSYEDEDVRSDEEIAGWCRVTDEEDAKKGIHEITCGIYGSVVHTTFAGSHSEASEKVEAIKRELKEYVMGCQDGTIDQNAWIGAFIARW